MGHTGVAMSLCHELHRLCETDHARSFPGGSRVMSSMGTNNFLSQPLKILMGQVIVVRFGAGCVEWQRRIPIYRLGILQLSLF